MLEKCNWTLLTFADELGFSGGSDGKEYACNAGDLALIPGLGRSPGEGKGYPLQYSGLENSMDYTVRTGQETTDWFQIEKGVHQGCILSP